MSDDGFLLGYPCYLIARYSADAVRAVPSLRQRFAITDADGQPALMLFTDPGLAENMLIAETVAGHIVPIRSPALLADAIEQFCSHFELVLIDPNPATGKARGFPVDQFLSELRRG